MISTVNPGLGRSKLRSTLAIFELESAAIVREFSRITENIAFLERHRSQVYAVVVCDRRSTWDITFV